MYGHGADISFATVQIFVWRGCMGDGDAADPLARHEQRADCVWGGAARRALTVRGDGWRRAGEQRSIPMWAVWAVL